MRGREGSSPRVRGKQEDRPGHGRGVRLIPARAGKTRNPRNEPRCSRAHPRACGENWSTRQGSSDTCGSSPRVRGKLRHPQPQFRRDRLIPARAGKTRRGAVFRPGSPAHPRACGENVTPSGSARPTSGSSPRVRGKPGNLIAGQRGERLIPARAGKTSYTRQAISRQRAHPRACGENSAERSPAHLVQGSSPRVRGKQGHAPRAGHGDGLIPARAGKTPARPPRGRTPRAHPRACGENSGREMPSMSTRGSSPRVRGKLQRHRQVAVAGRLIPARAGKTRATTAAVWPPRAHPRACGENDGGDVVELCGHGSSPRVRGKLTWKRAVGPFPGLIPARAGKTPRPCPTRSGAWAHPRACGENPLVYLLEYLTGGSSPRVRGKLLALPALRLARGLIPARAGKTPGVAHRFRCLPGSSPRVRGKHGPHRCQGGPRRLIPARAGKTAPVPTLMVSSTAHPRACGENSRAEEALRPRTGSSPRVRGKLRL